MILLQSFTLNSNLKEYSLYYAFFTHKIWKTFRYWFSVNPKIGIFFSKTKNKIGFLVILEQNIYLILGFSVPLEMVLENLSSKAKKTEKRVKKSWTLNLYTVVHEIHLSPKSKLTWHVELLSTWIHRTVNIILKFFKDVI